MKLKPVTFVNAKYNRTKHRQNTTQQVLLLKALKITQDPQKLKQMIGVRTVAEVFRTLDKMAMRREYHSALINSGIDFKFIVDGIKTECLGAEKSADRLKGYQILLKSMGMDNYNEKTEGGGGGWEEALQKITKEKEESKQLEAPEFDDDGEYEVDVPELPESVKKRKELEEAEGKSLYG